jgi:transcriptional regulator with XRE-family HTH domain
MHMARNSSSSSSLPVTLAERIRFLREKRYLTAEMLAMKALVPVSMIEDIEAGIEMFLAPSVRQRIARVLHVRPTQIQEAEKLPEINDAETPMLQRKGISLREEILRDPDAPHLCPSCGAPLAVRQFERRDLQDNPLLVIKANCTRCLFRMTDD